MRKAIALLPAIFMAMASSAASCYWVSYQGSYEGPFSDVNHWESKKLPGSGDNIYARADNKSNSKIILDGAYTIGYLCEKNGSFKLGGAGSLTETSGTHPHIFAKCTLEVTDSVFYNALSANEFTSSGILRLSGGGMVTKVYNPGTVTEICGGALTNTTANYLSGSLCRISSGIYRATDTLTFSSGSALEVSGGSVSAQNSIIFEGGSAFTLTGGTVFSSSGVFRKGAVLSATGGNAFAGGSVEFKSGATFALTNGTVVLGKATFAAGSRICLGENAVLRLPHTSRITTADIMADPTAKIVVTVAEGAAAARSCPILLPAGVDIEPLVAVECEAPDGWCFRFIGSCGFLTGGVATTPSKSYEWTGAEDGNWSNTNNWHGGVAPTNTGLWVYISGEKNTVITNDVVGTSVKGIYIRSGTAPVLIRGNPIKLTSDTSGYNNEITLRSDSSFPVIFENEIVFATKYGYSQARSSRIEHRGGISHSSGNSDRYVRYSGTCVYGGSGTMRRLIPRASSECTLTFLSDANYTLTEQVDGPNSNYGASASLTYGGALTMLSGSLLTVKGPWCQAASASSKIDGTLNFAGKLRGLQRFYGAGLVKTSGSYNTDVVGTNFVYLGGSITLLPAAWNTQPGAATAFRICATNGTPRLAAAGDWTYGPAEGVAADAARAMHIATAATLTIDTQNADTAQGHTITFTDPLIAEGSLVKDGAGTLVLPPGKLSIGGSFTLKKGTVKIDDAVDVAGVFTAHEGAKLEFGKDFLGNSANRTVLTAGEIAGVPDVPSCYCLKSSVDSESGRTILRLFRNGTQVILR